MRFPLRFPQAAAGINIPEVTDHEYNDKHTKCVNDSRNHLDFQTVPIQIIETGLVCGNKKTHIISNVTSTVLFSDSRQLQVSAMDKYDFTNGWFDHTARKTWDQVIPKIKPKKILEIGSYEGASACYLIDNLDSSTGIELHCVDTWGGGIEHIEDGVDMEAVESRFDKNVAMALKGKEKNVSLIKHKEQSELVLSKLISDGQRSTFDFVYVDGSHQAPDVLVDAVLGFKLLRVGGTMAFDDYLWAEDLPYGKDPIRCAKPAIDAFTNLYFRKVQILRLPFFYQVHVQKYSE